MMLYSRSLSLRCLRLSTLRRSRHLTSLLTLKELATGGKLEIYVGVPMPHDNVPLKDSYVMDFSMIEFPARCKIVM